MARLLMCPPDYFGVEYEINPWMSMERAVDPVRAREQWQHLYETLTGPVAAEVLLVEPRPGLPDMVFTANAGLVYGDQVVLSNFRHQERCGEAPHFGDWFREHGYTVHTLPQDRYFEGAGDALFVGDDLFAGYRFRTDIYSHRQIGEMLGVRVISLELVDPRFYHLDTCFCPVDRETAAYFPPAFDPYAQRAIEANVRHRIVLEEADAVAFGSNAVVVGQHVVLNTGCDTLGRHLREQGFEVHPVDLSEFLKAGGSAKCLSLALDVPTAAPRVRRAAVSAASS